MLTQTAEYEVYLLYVDSLTPPTTPRGGGRYDCEVLQPTPVLFAIDEPLVEVANPVLPDVSRLNAQIVEAVMVDNQAVAVQADAAAHLIVPKASPAPPPGGHFARANFTEEDVQRALRAASPRTSQLPTPQHSP